ncbi:MAG: hypothetical protein IPN71_16860 [Fibrobacteres bacterium]|nr:hypothetical protein [Fibrobacterota bacterium]
MPAIKDCYAPHLPSRSRRLPLDINDLQITGRVTHVKEFMDDYYVYLVAEGVLASSQREAVTSSSEGSKGSSLPG